jgi:hypothetical protein
MQLIPRHPDDKCLRVVAMTRGDEDMDGPIRPGDFAFVRTDNGEVRVCVQSADNGSYSGMITDGPDDERDGQVLLFAEVHVHAVHPPIRFL